MLKKVLDCFRIGLGAPVSGARVITDGMLQAAAECLSSYITDGEIHRGILYPSIDRSWSKGQTVFPISTNGDQRLVIIQAKRFHIFASYRKHIFDLWDIKKIQS
ncbi:hypothetical protein ACH5RR_000221 [Cinchona calisaya]|uniref:Malic enzyme NAD-binding domain-containing protein n=1 Tax=Cinchona calisaya TaxID=153742 RepID=A0ABD3B0I0_9GENT